MTAPTEQPYQVMPPLTDVERHVLRQSIEKNGVLEAVVFDEDGEILDGHHRVAIAEELDIDYPRRVLAGLDHAGKLRYAITTNAVRRQLAPAQVSSMIANLRIQGMSIRQIAEMTEVPRETVRRAVSGDPNGSPGRITGADGKSYASTRPTPTPEPVDSTTLPADPGKPPAPAGHPPDGDPSPQEPDPSLAQRVWDVLDQHGNRPFGLTVGEIWLKLDGVHSAAIPAALAELAGAGRAVVMSHAQGSEPQELRARWLTRLISRTPEPVAESAAHPGSGKGEAVAPVREGPGAAAEPTVEDRVAAALDQHVPDPGAPARAWAKKFYELASPVHNLLLWLKPEDVATYADEQDVTTLKHLATSFADAHRRAVEAMNANVTPLRRVK